MTPVNCDRAPHHFKLAASTVTGMNPHYHPYTELTSPHSPPPDNNNYHPHSQAGPPHPMSNGHVMGGPGGPHMHHPGPQMDHQHQPYPQGGPHHHQHHLNNNSNNTNNNCPTVKVCAGCGGKIVERFLLHALDRYWHNSCLKCSCCGAMLADIGGSCFTKANMILCKTDYIRLFGNSGACAACGQTIPASEFVMRAGPGQTFHLKCFACSKCGSQLVPGDRYCLLAGSLVCEQDWHKLIKGTGPTGTGTVRKGKVGRPRRSRD